MTLAQSFILGIIEGLTEFLPISSTAHLILTSQLLAVQQTEFVKFFEVFIQSGAILAVVILYLQYVLKHKYLISHIFISFIPTALIGFLLHDIIKEVFFESNLLIAQMLFGGGVAFILLEFLIQKGSIKLTKEIGEMSPAHALLIGCAQALAVVPGVSRAGAVIVAMILLKYKRTDAAVYSFLLAAPTVFAASAYDLLKTDISLLSHGANVVMLTIGFVTAFVTAYFVIRWFIAFLQQNTLVLFGIYRIILAVGILLAPVV